MNTEYGITVIDQKFNVLDYFRSMAFSSSAMGLEKGFSESLKKEQEQLEAARYAEAREMHRRKSFSKGSQYVLRALRRMRSQKLWLGFAQWRDLASYKSVKQSSETINTEDRKLADIDETLVEVSRIVQETRLSNAVAEQNRKEKLLNAEAEAAAEIANRPLNALARLQAKLENLFSDDAVRRNRLRRLSNLIHASARGDADRICQILDDTDDSGGKFDLNMKNDAGLCALVVATVNGSLNVLKSLLKRGANLELRDESGASPLIIAVKQRAWTMCCELLSHNANPNARDNFGDSALTMVIRLESGNRERRLLRLLLQYGADPCMPDSKLNTPIHVSTTRSQRTDLLTILLDESKDGVLSEQSLCTCLTSRGETPMLTAARFGHFTHIEILIQACCRQASTNLLKKTKRLWDVTDIHGESPLHAAAMRNEVEMVRLLLDVGADIDLKSETEETALDLAITLGCREVAEMLLDAKNHNVKGQKNYD